MSKRWGMMSLACGCFWSRAMGRERGGTVLANCAYKHGNRRLSKEDV